LVLTPGARLGAYEITALIGEGGMGQVFRAHDTALNRDVAIKVLPGSFANDAERLDRLTREAQTLASLNHPHIAAIYGLEEGPPEGGPHTMSGVGAGLVKSGVGAGFSRPIRALVMELVEGEDLSQRIARGAIPIDEALPIAKQIAEALDAAHERGIVHRDLKPANIKVRSDGTVKVLDFGLAKAMDPMGSASASASMSPTLAPQATLAGMILGTAAYMSPEQARGRPVDKRTDVWAFGALLYEMLTGARAFDGDDVTEMIAAVVKSTPDWSKLPADVPPPIVTLIQRCLEKDRKSRIGDIAVARFLLADHATLGIVAAASPSSPPRAASGVALPWAVAGVMTMVAAMAGALYLRQPAPAPAEVARFEFTLPDDAAFGGQISIAPDGRTIAFSATGGGEARRRLWVRDLGSVQARPLAGTEGTVEGLFWLPDSQTLVFSAGGKLKKIVVSGGPAQSLCDFNSNIGGGFLTADNRIVFGTPSTLGIQACPAGGGAATAITTLKSDGQELYHAFPSLLPDGRHFLFWRGAGPESGIYVGSLEAKPDEQTGTRVLSDSSAPAYVPNPDGGPGRILFVRDGTLMAQRFDADTLAVTGDAVPVGEDLRTLFAFSASSDGTLAYVTGGGSNAQLTWFDRQGTTLETVGRVGRAFGRAFGGMRISPDGTRLAGNRSAEGSRPDIWVVDLVQGAETRLTTHPGSDTNPVWSPDGGRIAFASSRAGTDNLYARAADGAGSDELLLMTGERKRPLDWSRDGRFLLFETFAAKGYDVWVLPMDTGPGGERKPAPYMRTDANESNARFSPDGRFVAYVSDESGSAEVYVRPFDPASPEASGTGGGKVRVSPNGATAVWWEPNGKALVFITADRKRWVVDLTVTPALRVGVPRLLGEFPRGNFEMAPDGQRALIGVPVGDQRPSATVVLNWQAGLKPSRR
jgi:Tol biopolymer transport system component